MVHQAQQTHLKIVQGSRVNPDRVDESAELHDREDQNASYERRARRTLHRLATIRTGLADLYRANQALLTPVASLSISSVSKTGALTRHARTL